MWSTIATRSRPERPGKTTQEKAMNSFWTISQPGGVYPGPVLEVDVTDLSRLAESRLMDDFRALL